ncbi:MAG: hypothetical protein NT120_03225, partial [Candidatus Aenigmarchaeota archaeon]|nr:hypothetical protein [Candidatus Aenigmarchaeota archaeon]
FKLELLSDIMIQWFAFNFMVMIVSLSLLFGIKNGIANTIAIILIVVTLILIIKDFFVVRG